ncbi:hypothetical protein ETB97_009870 [Aspergillus alliaceus]|uniref:Uncharacterized protein n=1 Tax=Petromyces alliaceus TaxID=209559 RepID=A0A8H6AHF3_PETAA|nr:hypothetical protein ETB97_009870 [Aspergillus burnettii]
MYATLDQSAIIVGAKTKLQAAMWEPVEEKVWALYSWGTSSGLEDHVVSRFTGGVVLRRVDCLPEAGSNTYMPAHKQPLHRAHLSIEPIHTSIHDTPQRSVM